MTAHARDQDHDQDNDRPRSRSQSVTMTKSENGLRYEFRSAGSKTVKSWDIPADSPVGDRAAMEKRLHDKAVDFFANESKADPKRDTP